eukprot:TRINITY_DN32673_c0_g1_i1.p1 TRINITY_DN32673_c0_g1~~TRINITY_DN32673_c0_g1_i1.p1  ORF type:complete len:454 (+),score=123.37 TRINITY_DN32673_c0_g1_i1:64-1362(+)
MPPVPGRAAGSGPPPPSTPPAADGGHGWAVPSPLSPGGGQRLARQVTELRAALSRVSRACAERGMAAERGRLECARLESELRDREERVDAAMSVRRRLEEELAEQLSAGPAASRRDQELDAANGRYLALGRELLETRERLAGLEREAERLRSENNTLKQWLDRGVEECARVAEQCAAARGSPPASPPGGAQQQVEGAAAVTIGSDELQQCAASLRSAAATLAYTEDALLRDSADGLRHALQGQQTVAGGSAGQPTPQSVCAAAGLCSDLAGRVAAAACRSLGPDRQAAKGSEAAAGLLRRLADAQQSAAEGRRQATDAAARAAAAEKGAELWQRRAAELGWGTGVSPRRETYEAQVVAAHLVSERNGLRLQVAALKRENAGLREAAEREARDVVELRELFMGLHRQLSPAGGSEQRRERTPSADPRWGSFSA